MLPFFPASLMGLAKKSEVIAWIYSLPVPRGTKKQMFLEWSETNAYKATAQDYKDAGAEPPNEASSDDVRP